MAINGAGFIAAVRIFSTSGNAVNGGDGKFSTTAVVVPEVDNVGVAAINSTAGWRTRRRRYGLA